MLLLLPIFPKGVVAQQDKLSLELQQLSAKYNVNQVLAQRIITCESDWNPIAIDYNKINHSQNDMILKVYAVNYNILRIASGMGGLAFSN